MRPQRQLNEHVTVLLLPDDISAPNLIDRIKDRLVWRKAVFVKGAGTKTKRMSVLHRATYQTR